ncbi:hypothetical protein EON77_13125 [bacterium]|nr:MAG: hypothetical protein EON77_13125 [bacterium]
MIDDAEIGAYVDGELDATAHARIAAAIAVDPALARRVDAQRKLKDRPRWNWREWSAIAATLVLGVLLGPYVLRASQTLPFVSAGGRVVAIGALERALMRQASGGDEREADGLAIGLSYRTNDGVYCRTFAMNRGPAGVACREWGEWVVEVLARNPRARQSNPQESYRQAGTAFPEAVRRAVEASIEGEPLTAEQEQELTRRNWRPDKRL